MNWLPDGTDPVHFPRWQADMVRTEVRRLRSEGKESHALRVTDLYWALMPEQDPERLLESVTELVHVATLWQRELRARIGVDVRAEEFATDPARDLIRTGMPNGKGGRAHLARRGRLRVCADENGRHGHAGDSLCKRRVADQVYLDITIGWHAPVLANLPLCVRCQGLSRTTG